MSWIRQLEDIVEIRVVRCKQSMYGQQEGPFSRLYVVKEELPGQ